MQRLLSKFVQRNDCSSLIDTVLELDSILPGQAKSERCQILGMLVHHLELTASLVKIESLSILLYFVAQ